MHHTTLHVARKEGAVAVLDQADHSSLLHEREDARVIASLLAEDAHGKTRDLSGTLYAPHDAACRTKRGGGCCPGSSRPLESSS